MCLQNLGKPASPALQGALRVPPKVLGTPPNKIFPGVPRHQHSRGSSGTAQGPRPRSSGQDTSWNAAQPALQRLMGYHPMLSGALPTESFLDCRATNTPEALGVPPRVPKLPANRAIPRVPRHQHSCVRAALAFSYTKTLRKPWVWVQRCSFYVRPVHIGSNI